MLGISRFSIILIGSVLIAVLGARPYASSWNDGSRLATVEALVDQHTWAIDNSIFVKVPEQHDLDPYGRDVPSTGGTMDKMFINGHFYSHEPPVVALYMAGVYWVAQKLTGLTAAQQPHAFVYLITVIEHRSGLCHQRRLHLVSGAENGPAREHVVSGHGELRTCDARSGLFPSGQQPDAWPLQPSLRFFCW